MTYLYLIQRAERPIWHKQEYHRVVICDRKHVAEIEAGHTRDGANSWQRFTTGDTDEGWLLTRWRGLLVDYGPVVAGCVLPEGGHAGFWRDYESECSVRDLLPGAVWWSVNPMPAWLAARGVVYPVAAFVQQLILDDVANDGAWGFGRAIPAWWQAPQPEAGP